MAKITYIEPCGNEVSVEADSGTLMENAIENGINGITSSCGGMASCAACHIKIPLAWHAKLEEKNEDEIDALEFIDDPTPESRLACQIAITEDLDGIVVKAAGDDF